MKRFFAILFFSVLILVGCGPSEAEIQKAIFETQTATVPTMEEYMNKVYPLWEKYDSSFSNEVTMSMQLAMSSLSVLNESDWIVQENNSLDNLQTNIQNLGYLGNYPPEAKEIMGSIKLVEQKVGIYVVFQRIFIVNPTSASIEAAGNALKELGEITLKTRDLINNQK